MNRSKEGIGYSSKKFRNTDHNAEDPGVKQNDLDGRKTLEEGGGSLPWIYPIT